MIWIMDMWNAAALTLFFLLVVLCAPQAQGKATAILLFCSYCKSNLFYIDLSLE